MQDTLSNIPEDSAAERYTEQLCERIRALRKDRGWSLDQLAAASTVSRSMLSEIERQRANPTLAVAYRIARAFGFTLEELVALPEQPPKVQVIRHDDAAMTFRHDAVCTIVTLSPLPLEKDVEFYRVELHPAQTLESAAHFAGTREMLTVAAGEVEVTSNEERHVLQAGDSATYRADVPHRVRSLSTKMCTLYLVVIYR